MTTDENGQRVSVEYRLDGIFERYAHNDPVHVSIDAAKAHLLATIERVEGSLVAAGNRR